MALQIRTLGFGDKVLDLVKDTDVFEALAEITSAWHDNRETLQDLNVSDVFDLIDSAAREQSFFDALTTLGLDGASVQAAVTLVSEALGRIPEKYRKLVKPLADFDEGIVGSNPGLVPWAILDAGSATSGGTRLTHSFDLAATGALELEAGDTWPRADEPMPDPLLRLGVRGSVKAKANASLPLTFGLFRAGTDNSSSASLDYFFEPQDTTAPYVSAVARSIGGLCDPFSFDSIWRAVQRSDLKGLVLHLDGSTALEVEVGLAEGFALASDLVTAEAGLTIGAKVKFSGKHDLVIRALPSSGDELEVLEVTLLRQSLNDESTNLKLGIEFDLSKIAERLREILKRHQGDFSTVLEKYREYLSPGTYLQTRLGTELNEVVEALVGDDAVRGILQEALAGATGATATPSLGKLKTLIKDEVASVLDGLGQVITSRASDVSDEAVKVITKKLDLNAIAERVDLDLSSATDILKEKIAKLVGGIQADLENSMSSLGAEQIDQIEEAIEKSGVIVSGAASQADRALKGVREIISKYEALLKKLIVVTEESARARITANLTREEARTRGKVINVRMLVDRNTEVAARAFDTLIKGDMTGIVALLKSGSAGVTFDRENMILSRFAKVQKKLGFELVLLGFEFGAQSIFDAEAQVTSDGLGRVSVSSKATVTKRRSSPKEEREILFVDAYSLAAARQTKVLNINLDISHKDEELRRGEVVKFLDSFEQAALLTVGTVKRAGKLFDEWAGGGGDRKIKADIKLELSLDERASKRLMRLSEKVNGDLTESCMRNVFGLALQEMVDGGAYSAETVAEVAEAVRAQTRMSEDKSRIDVLFDYDSRLHKKTVSSGNLSPTFHKKRIRELERAARLHRLCRCFVDFIETMGDIYEAEPSLDGTDGWTESDYVTAQKKLGRSIKEWMKVNSKFLFWIDEEAHPRTVSFVGALFALSGAEGDLDDSPILTLTLQRHDGGGETVTFV